MKKTLNDTELKTALAEYAHDAWSGWMKYLFEKSSKNNDGSVTIPKWAADRWTRQSETCFKDIPEDETPEDYNEADKMLTIFEKYKGAE